MDTKQMAAQCRQMMAGQSAEGGAAAGMREQCGQMAARFSGKDETADEPEQSEPEGPQPA